MRLLPEEKGCRVLRPERFSGFYCGSGTCFALVEKWLVSYRQAFVCRQKKLFFIPVNESRPFAGLPFPDLSERVAVSGNPL